MRNDILISTNFFGVACTNASTRGGGDGDGGGGGGGGRHPDNYIQATNATMGCGWRQPSCTISVSPTRTWGGLGNMLPIFASLARPAFAKNCTVRFNESETRRLFRFNDYFTPPELIPRSRGLSCVLRALTSRLSTEVARQVGEVQALARVPARVSCNGSQHSRRLVGLHVRTGWADKRLVAAPYKCEPTSEPRASVMRDEVAAAIRAEPCAAKGLRGAI